MASYRNAASPNFADIVCGNLLASGWYQASPWNNWCLETIFENSNGNSNIFIKESALETVVCKMWPICSNLIVMNITVKPIMEDAP